MSGNEKITKPAKNVFEKDKMSKEGVRSAGPQEKKI